MATRKDAIDFSQDLADAFLEHVAMGGTVAKFCAPKDRPDKASIFRWLSKRPDFASAYTVALQMKADAYADETIDISDGNGDPAKVRNQLAARWWLSERLKPKRYVPKLALEHSGEVGLTVIVKRFTPDAA